MPLRNIFHFDTSFRGRRWQLPILLPVLLALALVVTLAVQSVRTAQMHRRAVANALRDYASFAAWQYTRRASDYLRLTIGVRLAGPLANSDVPRSGIECRAIGANVIVTRNATSFPNHSIESA